MNNCIASNQLESELGFNLPEDYKDFIDQQGYLSLGNISTEIYGYKPGFDKAKLPCVIAATELCRGDYNLSGNEIVISHSGLEDSIIILDALSGKVFERNLYGEKMKIADSFSAWLTALKAKNSSAS